MPEQTLKEKTAKGLFWGGISNGIQQILNILFGVFLARLLSPGDYGLVGMLAIFMGVASTIQDSGFSTALINKKEIKHEDYNAVFWFSLVSGILMYAILFFCAPLIADFYGHPELKDLARVMFLWFLFGSTATAHSAMLMKKLMVKERAKISIVAMIFSGAIGVWMAYIGMAYWGIVMQAVINSFVGTILCWYYSPWRPTLSFKIQPLKDMFPFSIKLLATNIFNQINGNIFTVLLGRYYLKQEVGYYTQGNKWMNMGYTFIWNMIGGIAQPVLAEVAADTKRQQVVFRKLLRFVSFVSFPTMLGLAFVSRELIIIVVSDKWLPCVPIMQLLCIWGAITPICNLYMQMLLSRGKSDIYLINTIALGLLQLLVVFSMLSYGIYYMVLSYVIVNILWIFVWHYFGWRYIHLNLTSILKDILPFLITSLVVLAITNYITHSIENIYILFILKILLATILYVVVMWVSKAVVLRESIQFLLNR